MSEARNTLAKLEAMMIEGDELMARVIADLREHADCIDELEQAERYRSLMRAATSGFVVEAASALREQKPDLAAALFGRIPAPAWHQ